MICALICIGAYIYAFKVILCKPETRKNLLLLSVTVFHTIAVGFMCARLFVAGLDSSPLIDEIYSFAWNMANWVFQILLLETAIMLPVIFRESSNPMEKFEEAAIKE